MAKAKVDIEVDIDKCKGCEVCIAACPEDVIVLAKEVNGKGYHYAIKQNDNCTGCTNCAVVCPDGVITVYRAKAVPA